MNTFLGLLLSGIISGSVVATILTVTFKRKTEKIAAEVKDQFDRNLMMFKSGQQWKEKSVSELLGPICLEFSRTFRALVRYHATDLYLEANVLKKANERIRDLLLTKAYLIPGALFEDASELIEHYDAWLEEYNKQRDKENPNLEQKFVFVGPRGFPFPSHAEKKFKAKYDELWNELYGDNQKPALNNK